MSINQRRGTVAALLTTAFTIAGTWAAHAAVPGNTLYIESNDPATGQNAVLGYHRNIDGSLTRLNGSPFLTGGTGFAVPLTAPPGPFDGQNILLTDPVRGVLYVPNGGSDNVSSMRIAADGTLSSIPGSPFAITGNTPEAFGLYGRTLIIVNNATDPNQATTGIGPSYDTARLDAYGGVHQIVGGNVPLAPGSIPTEALPADNTPIISTNQFGASTVSEYFLDFVGRLHLLGTQVTPSAPLGQDISARAPYVYVGLPVASAIAVYRLNGLTESLVGTVPTTAGTAASPSGTGAAPCWVRVSADGRFAYSSNTASHSITLYDLRKPSAPAALQTLVLNGVVGATFDFRLSPDGRFMYVVEGATAAQPNANQVHVLSVDRATGLMTEIASSPVNLNVSGHRVQGIAVD